MRFSKSKYCLYVSCPKQLWMKENMPAKEIVSADAQSRMDQGTEVGKLARGYFGGYELAEITVNGKQDHDAMIKRTKELMAEGTQVICEAAFAYKNNYCAVDILRKEGGGWAIYEVKSYNNLKDHPICYHDVAYQRYVLEKCGINVTGVYVLHFNKKYMRHGNIDINKLFMAEDVLKDTQEPFVEIEENLIEAEKYLSQICEPSTIFSGKCEKCGFKEHCHKDVPSQSVLNLRGFSNKYNYAGSGIMTFEQVRQKGKTDNITYDKEVQLQLDHDIPAKGAYIDRAGIRDFLGKLSYPLYFLDYETFQYALPAVDDSSPWQQIPSQYSLHWIESEADALEIVNNLGNSGHPLLHHSEFLGTSDDPRRELAERLCRDIPKDVCITAYNKTFECGITDKLAAIFPDLREHLLNIKDHIVDLMDPFKEFRYYNSAMQGSYSIKYVLPAIYPALNYANLSGVHNGTQAMNLYPQLKSMPSAQQQQARQDLLKYCELDTFAMVKLWQELVWVS